MGFIDYENEKIVKKKLIPIIIILAALIIFSITMITTASTKGAALQAVIDEFFEYEGEYLDPTLIMLPALLTMKAVFYGILIAFIVGAIIVLVRIQIEATSSKLGALKNLTLIMLIIAAIIFVYEIVVLSVTQKAYSSLDFDASGDFANIIYHGIALSFFTVSYLFSRKLFRTYN